MRVVRYMVLGSLIVLLANCSPSITDTVADRQTNTPAGVSDAAPTAIAQQPSPTANTRPTVGATVSIGAPTATVMQPTPTVSQMGQFSIDATSSSDNGTLETIELTLISAELTDDALAIKLSFRNTGDQSFRVIGDVGGSDARLMDSTGKSYEPDDVDDNLDSIDPADGFTPGAANVGTLTFPRPKGEGPYEFGFPTYTPISFQLDTPLADSTVEIAEQSYPIDQSLRSNQSALGDVALDVRSLEITADSLIFDVAFTNLNRQGYDLITGPTGEDARLLDANGRSYAPGVVSDSLSDSIAPEDGWGPDETNEGTLTFPRPDALSELRLIFPTYDALSLQLDNTGIAQANVTSATGGERQPTATPQVEDIAFEQIQQVLAQQADALLANNLEQYLATFTPELHEKQQTIFEHAAAMPFDSYAIGLAPSETLTGADTGEVSRAEVTLSYTLQGIDAENAFVYDLTYDFVQQGDDWLISAAEVGDSPPFWYLGDVTFSQTEHFLVFARPDAEAALPTVEQEAETAYATLADRGLPLEPRYVAYFTNSGDDFAALTNRTPRRTLGVALSRYAFEGAEITVNSKAFYINGEVLGDPNSGLSPQAQQTTVTHELVHLALAPVTRPFTPPWVAEGAAVYYSDDLGPERRQLLLAGSGLENTNLSALTTAGTLGEHDFVGEQTGYEYIFSGEAFAYLVETYGEQATLDFYRSYADVPAEDVRDRMPRFFTAFGADSVFSEFREELTTQAVQEFFSVSLKQLDADVKAWLQ